MGFSSSKKRYLSNEDIEKLSRYNPTLERIYDKFKDYDGYFKIREFDILMQMKVEYRILKKLYKIFSSERDKFTFEDLKHFYSVMRTSNISAKYCFLTDLIFSNKNSKIYQKYIERINLMFNKCSEMKSILLSSNFINKISDKNRKIQKDLFIKQLDNNFRKDIVNFSFIKLLTYTNYDIKDKNIQDFKDFTYLICGCYLNKQTNKNDNFNLFFDRMESEFRKMERNNEGVFTIQILEKMFKEIEINNNLSNLLITYIKRKTEKNFIDFKIFKELYDRVNSNSNEKISFLFEILSFPKQSFSKTHLLKLINLDKEDIKNIPNEINLNTYNTIVSDLNHYIQGIINMLSRIAYIPYIYFKLKPDNIEIERKCIELIMKGEKNLEKYIYTLIEKENQFYALDINFWNEWLEKDTIKGRFRIENERIVEFSTKIKEDLKVFKDFILIPQVIYELFIRWYNSIAPELKLRKIIYPFTNKLPTNPHIIKDGNIHEIEIYPIQIKHYLFDELTKYINDNSLSGLTELMKNLFQNKSSNTNRYLNFSRYDSYGNIKSKLEQHYHIKNMKTILWVYHLNKIFKAEEDKTIENDNVNEFCIIVLEVMTNNTWISDSYINGLSFQPRTKDYGRVKVGISNIGNTCYMNAVLQILLNIKEINEILLSNNFKNCINVNSKYGFKGKIINEFIKLLCEKWQEKENNIIPLKFKQLIGESNIQFKNNDQQDASEFFTFLLDTLHEETNLKEEKEYISNPDNYDGTEEELANEYWSNNLRRNSSVIHSLFLGQLKSNLICAECGSKKTCFETFTSLSMPIPQKKSISIEIILHRIPFIFKVYYLDNYCKSEESNDLKNSMIMLRKQSIDKYIENEENNNKFYTFRSTTPIPIKIILELDRKSKVEKIVESLKSNDELELEKGNQYTNFIIMSYEGNFIDQELKIDECIQPNQIIHVFELLNTNGILRYEERENESRVVSALNHDIVSYFNKSIYFEKNLNYLKTEYLIQIIHRNIIEAREYLFRRQAFSKLDHFFYVILVNNETNFTAKFLYDYIWEKYEYTLNNPSLIKENLWWNNSNILDIKYCFPFTIKLINKDNNTCYFCPWFRFCVGCSLDPWSNEIIIIPPSCQIVVEWCGEIYENHLNINNLRLIVNHESTKKSSEDNSSKTLHDCLNLFLEKEFLEGNDQEIYCSKCRKLQNFYKKYDIDRLPPILILSLKRFKYAKLYKKKIDNTITFPLFDLELKKFVSENSDSSSNYDLFGIINHTGSLSGGHYTTIIKHDDKWIKYDDANCYEVDESIIITSGAYILIYKLKEEINTNYFNLIKGLIDNMEDIYYKGEPVRSPYGRGFIEETKIFEGIDHVHVKYRFGRGFLNKNIVNKEIKLNLTNNNFNIEEKKESKNNIQKKEQKRDSNCYII